MKRPPTNLIMKILLYFLSLTLINASCSSTDESIREAESKPALPSVIEKDVSYGENSQQMYDLYLPEGRKEATTKTIVVIHGGSWVGGDKADLNGIVASLQTSLPDYAVVNMNYRLANGGSIKAFPTQLEDIETVLKDLQSRKTELQINGDVALLGASAGAHISLLYAATINTNSQVKALINIVGPTDFTDPYYRDNQNFQLFLDNLVDKSAYPDGADLPALLSPAQQITATTPPTINFYGNADPLVAISQLKRLENGLEENSVPFESTIYDGGHGNWNATQYVDLQVKLNAFLAQHF